MTLPVFPNTVRNLTWKRKEILRFALNDSGFALNDRENALNDKGSALQ
ncbi:hypothetical protein TFUB22_00483 [Tannerella forsythia]|nr:hypothetical protein TFUB22_00483 [Tannerella forsythia]